MICALNRRPVPQADTNIPLFDRRRNTNAAFPYVPELRRGSPARSMRFDKIE